MKKLSLFSLFLILSISEAEDPANPEVVYPIEIIGRSWIDASNIHHNWNHIPLEYDPAAYFLGITQPLVLGIDWSVARDTRGIAKDKLYRLWSKVVLEAKLKNGNLTVKKVSKDVDGGQELFEQVDGTYNITEPILVKEGNVYKFNYLCWGAPHYSAELMLQLIKPRTSNNIWHRITGEIFVENGALKYVFRIYGASSFPMQSLYVNTILIEESVQTHISDLWIPDPENDTFVRRRQ